MKRLVIIYTLILAALSLNAQDEFKPSGKGIGNVFFNYRYQLNDVTQRSSFNLDRAYLGYQYDFSRTISARVVLDGTYDNASRTFVAFPKNAQIDWTILPKVKLTMGLFGLRQFDTQERFWGYRYIMKTFVDEYKLGTSADFGINVELPVSPVVTFNAFVINGEGFRTIQDGFGLHKFGANVVLTPSKKLVLKAHYDLRPSKYQADAVSPIEDTATISNFSAFVGYRFTDNFRWGIEYNTMYNGIEFTRPAENYNLGGISTYATYIINPKFEVFGRYDWLRSNELDGEDRSWNYSREGSLALVGVQYNPIKGVAMALNYRTFIYRDDENVNPSWLYLNLGFNF